MTTYPSRRSAWIRLTGAITLAWLGVVAAAPALAASREPTTLAMSTSVSTPTAQCQAGASPCDDDGSVLSGTTAKARWWVKIAISVVGAAIWDGIKWFIRNLGEFWEWLKNRDVSSPSCSTDFLNEMSSDPC